MSDLPMCFVCFDTGAPAWPEVGEAVMQRLLQPRPLPAASPIDGGVLLDFPDGQVAVMAIDAPYPALPDNDLSQRAIWPNLDTARPFWRSHVIIAPFGGSVSFAARRQNIAAVVRTASAYAALDSAAAVCWSGNGLFIPPAAFCAQADEDALHPEIVVRCRWWRKPGVGVGARTAGLAGFGLPELSHPPTGENSGTIHNRLLTLGRRMVERGPATGWADATGLGLDTQVWIEETPAEDGGTSLVVHRSEVQAFT